MDTFTSDSGVKSDIVEVGNEYILLQKSSQSSEVQKESVGDYGSDTDMVSDIICKHLWYQRGLGTPHFCAICGFQEEMPTCKSCLGKKKLSVYTNQVISPDFIGDKPHHTGEDDIQYVNCSRCEGTGCEPKAVSEKQDFGDYKMLEKLNKDLLGNYKNTSGCETQFIADKHKIFEKDLLDRLMNNHGNKQDFGWIYDCAKAIKEYREEEGSRWTTEGIEEIISRHYKHI